MAGKVYTKTGDLGNTGLGTARIAKTHPVVGLMGTLDELNAHLGLCVAHFEPFLRRTEKAYIDCHNCMLEILNTLQSAQTELYEMSGDIHRNFNVEKEPSRFWKFSNINVNVINVLMTFNICVWVGAIINVVPANMAVVVSGSTLIVQYINGFLTETEQTETEHINNQSVINEARHAESVQKLEFKMDKMSESLEKLTRFVRPGGSKMTAQLHVCRTVCRRAERKFFEAKVSYNMDWKNITIQMVYLNRLSDYLFVLSRYLMQIENLKEEYFSHC